MKSKKGISLIILIVTIIVIIILAAVVILTLSKNNPIDSAKEASFKEDARTFQDELAMYISKDYTSKAGQRDNKITSLQEELKPLCVSYRAFLYKLSFIAWASSIASRRSRISVVSVNRAPY